MRRKVGKRGTQFVKCGLRRPGRNPHTAEAMATSARAVSGGKKQGPVTVLVNQPRRNSVMTFAQRVIKRKGIGLRLAGIRDTLPPYGIFRLGAGQRGKMRRYGKRQQTPPPNFANVALFRRAYGGGQCGRQIRDFGNK